MFKRMGTAGQAFVAACVALSGFGYALAQESGNSTVNVVKVEAVGGPSEQEPLSPAQQLDAAEAAVATAAANCAAQSKALQSAKREKDIIRATCLDDKVSQCDANLQNMKRRRSRRWAMQSRTVTRGAPTTRARSSASSHRNSGCSRKQPINAWVRICSTRATLRPGAKSISFRPMKTPQS